ncbi:MAG TPA: WD40 repeat domain-containing protein, partial [Thermoanaerobaculia bacterium]
LHDISREGRVLLAEEHSREGMIGLSPGEEKERDLSWHDWSRPVDLTPDGTRLLFDETGEGGGAGYAVYLRRTDDSAAVRLGEGHALALSPDGRWALSTPQATPAVLVLLPTGAGEPRRLATGNFGAIQRAAWLPRRERLVLAANEAGHGTRLYVQPASGGVPRAITPEGVGPEWAVSPDGAAIAGVGPDRRLRLYPVDAGEPSEVAGAAAGDAPVRFSPDGQSLYVLERGDGAAFAMARIDIASGERTRWKDIGPAGVDGMTGLPRVLLSADGQSYVYPYVRLLDELFLVDGLR